MNGHNPDILTCLANLSADEVFTPPKLASTMLDILPQDLFQRSDTTFLDPVCKSGVFLREIARRLNDGLADQMPDDQKRIDHILTKQVFGLAITELTSLISRRSLYCSKKADGKYSIATAFDKADGNIRLPKTSHKWTTDGRCEFCGASRGEYDRESGREEYAYPFIHGIDPRKVFDVKFDVIVGNPPYQLKDGGAQQSATPIYQHFISQAKKLQPRFLSMVVPARWFSGGKGLDEFRDEMLGDGQLREIHDFPSTNDLFSGLNIRGGVCYFLWERGSSGDCLVTSYRAREPVSVAKRPLREIGVDTFIRYNEAIGILRKVKAKGHDSFQSLVSSRKPFGLTTNFSNFVEQKSESKPIELYRFGRRGFISSSDVSTNREWIDAWKVFVPYASPGDDSYPHLVLSNPIVAGPNTACSETYLVVGPFDGEEIAQNAAALMRTKFFRFMIVLARASQHITRKTYVLTPLVDLRKRWTDESLYAYFQIDADEQMFIDSLVKQIG